MLQPMRIDQKSVEITDSSPLKRRERLAGVGDRPVQDEMPDYFGQEERRLDGLLIQND